MFPGSSRVTLSLSKQRGFSFLELLLVIVVISFLFYKGMKVYFNWIEQSKVDVIQQQANSFSRTINNLRASALIRNAEYVVLDNNNIYLNELGWPANTTKNMSAKSWNQTPEECQQLWQVLYQQPPQTILNISDKNASSQYLISSINGRICRYELLRKQDGAYFFDYHLSTGEVITSFEYD